ncbi:hypothetical protein NX059_011260 [Plenodomus lindquistii]|nr:hypothetical protein NX059_011260 [Plenodomus lindquistii]
MASKHAAQSIELQPAGVPADYVDPSHPHFPYDVESQPPAYKKSAPYLRISKRALWTAVAIFVVIGLIVGIVAASISICVNRFHVHEHAAPVITPSSVATSQVSGFHTVYITTTVSPLQDIRPDAPLRPIATTSEKDVVTCPTNFCPTPTST